MSKDSISLESIESLDLSSEERSFLSVFVQYLGALPDDYLMDLSKEHLGGDAMEVVKVLVAAHKMGVDNFLRSKAGVLSHDTSSRSLQKKRGVEEYARVLLEWARFVAKPEV